MAISRVKTWASGEILTSSDLNAEFNNILNNATSLVSPLTANLAAGSFKLTGLGAGSAAGDSVRLEQVGLAALTTIASATSPDIFAVTVGQNVDYTGTTTCTGFTTAPNAGITRTLICAGAAPFTAGSNLLIDGVASGGTYTAFAGAQVRVTAVTTTQFRLTPPASNFLPGHIFGLTMANDAGDLTNDINVVAGAAVDSTGAALIRLTSTLIKQLDAAWAVGNNAGMLDTGAIANGTYHIYIIQRPDTGVSDILASTSATAPTMPTNYTLKRRIGSILREAAAIVLFTQNGDSFQRTTSVADISAGNPGTAAVTRTLSVPTGVKVQADVIVGGGNNDASSGAYFYFSDLATTDSTPTGGIAEFGRLQSASGLSSEGYARRYIYTNTSAQVRSRVSFSSADVSLIIRTFGWIDRRGRDA